MTDRNSNGPERPVYVVIGSRRVGLAAGDGSPADRVEVYDEAGRRLEYDLEEGREVAREAVAAHLGVTATTYKREHLATLGNDYEARVGAVVPSYRQFAPSRELGGTHRALLRDAFREALQESRSTLLEAIAADESHIDDDLGITDERLGLAVGEGASYVRLLTARWVRMVDRLMTAAEATWHLDFLGTIRQRRSLPS
jgi:hypothetical protein